jgi:ribonuclease Z
MLRAGVAATDITRLCVTHFHGDHSLGLSGVIQRLSLDKVPHPVHAHFPASGAHYFERLRHATAFYETADLREHLIAEDGPIATGKFTLEARRLSHPVEAFGYRLVEPDGRTMLPERLREHGIAGPDVGKLQRAGRLGNTRLEDVSTPRPGQRFAFVMDTRLCDGVYALAEGADMLVIESTFLAEDTHLARDFGHLTARQAARVAAESGVRQLVLTHFSQRYPDPARFLDEAKAEFDGEIVVAEDLERVQVPKRRSSPAGHPAP